MGSYRRSGSICVGAARLDKLSVSGEVRCEGGARRGLERTAEPASRASLREARASAFADICFPLFQDGWHRHQRR